MTKNGLTNGVSHSNDISHDAEMSSLFEIFNILSKLDFDARFRIVNYVKSRVETDWNKVWEKQQSSIQRKQQPVDIPHSSLDPIR